MLAKYAESKATSEDELQLLQLMQEEKDLPEWELIVEEFMNAEQELTNYSKDRWQPVIEQILEKNSDRPSQRGKVESMSTRLRWIAAASIILVLGIASYVILGRQERKDHEQKVAKTTLDIEAPKGARAMITLADGRKVYLDSAGNGTLAEQGQVNVVKTEDGKIIYQPYTTGNAPLTYNTLTNPRGSKVIDMTLSDGSHVWLNAASSLRYPVAFVGNTRKVEITGEAYFEVAHDTKRPFIVSKADVSVQVLGTHFNINAFDEEGSIKTTLLQGSIRVSAAGKTQLVQPGQQAQVTGNTIKLVSNVDIDAVMAWKNGFFSFEDADIKQIMEQLSRWYDVEVIYQGEPNERFAGKIDRNLTLSQVLKILADTKVKYRIEDGKRLIILP